MEAFISTFLPFVVLLVAMWLLLIRPQKKKEKEINNMRNSLKVGDEIITIGGICGKIVKVKDESIVIQVGAERVKFEMMKWSVSKVVKSEANTGKKGRPAVAEEKEEPAKKALPKKLKKEEAVVEEAPEAVATEEASETTEA